MELALSIFLIIIALVELWLAIYFFRTNSGSLLRIYYAWFVLGVFVWVFSVGLWKLIHYFFPYPQHTISELIDRMAFCGPVILVTALLAISILFPYPIRRITKKSVASFIAIVVIFCLLLLMSDVFLIPAETRIGLRVVEFASYYWVYASYFLLLWLASVAILVSRWLRSSGYNKWLLSRFLIGIIGSGVIGVFTNLVLPFFFDNDGLWWAGPSASLIWLAVTTHIIRKQGNGG